MWNPHLVSSGNNDLNFCLLGNFSALPYSLFFLMITGSRIILISSHSISMVENTELLRKISAVICHSLSPRFCSNSCPLNWLCHLTISSSDICFSSCLQSFPASGSFPVSQLFSLGDQSIKVSASASVPPMNIQDWLPKYDWLVWSLCCPRDSQESSPASQFENINYLTLSLLYGPNLTSIHVYWKNHSFD